MTTNKKPSKMAFFEGLALKYTKSSFNVTDPQILQGPRPF